MATLPVMGSVLGGGRRKGAGIRPMTLDPSPDYPGPPSLGPSHGPARAARGGHVGSGPSMAVGGGAAVVNRPVGGGYGAGGGYGTPQPVGGGGGLPPAAPPPSLTSTAAMDPHLQAFHAQLVRRFQELEPEHDATTDRLVQRETSDIADRAAGAAAALKESQAGRGTSSSGAALAEGEALSDSSLRAQDRASTDIRTARSAQKEAAKDRLLGIAAGAATMPANLALAQHAASLAQWQAMTGADLSRARLELERELARRRHDDAGQDRELENWMRLSAFF